MYAKSFPLGKREIAVVELFFAALVKIQDATEDGNGSAAGAAPIPDNKDRDGGEQ